MRRRARTWEHPANGRCVRANCLRYHIIISCKPADSNVCGVYMCVCVCAPVCVRVLQTIIIIIILYRREERREVAGAEGRGGGEKEEVRNRKRGSTDTTIKVNRWRWRHTMNAAHDLCFSFTALFPSVYTYIYTRTRTHARIRTKLHTYTTRVVVTYGCCCLSDFVVFIIIIIQRCPSVLFLFSFRHYCRRLNSLYLLQ